MFSQLSNFQSFNSQNENVLSKKSQRSFVLLMFFPKYPIVSSFSLTCDVLFGDLEFLLLFDCTFYRPT